MAGTCERFLPRGRECSAPLGSRRMRRGGTGMGLGWDGAGGGFHTEIAHLEPQNQRDAGKL